MKYVITAKDFDGADAKRPVTITVYDVRNALNTYAELRMVHKYDLVTGKVEYDNGGEDTLETGRFLEAANWFYLQLNA